MMNDTNLILGYDFDKWYGYGIREAIYADASLKTNSHTLVCGMSGSGKSYATLWQFSKIYLLNQKQSKLYFCDFKQDDSFSFLQKCPRYYAYENTIDALEIVYNIMHKRQSGEDKSRYPVVLIWDEYMANILSLQGNDKKKAEEVMKKVSEILMLGRSLAVKIYISVQRADASAFPSGSRLNYGVIMILGAPIRSIYEMLIPKEYIDSIGDRKFGVGEGVALLQGSQLYYIKVPMVRDLEKMQRICIEALSK